jgi:hypothetical protein
VHGRVNFLAVFVPAPSAKNSSSDLAKFALRTPPLPALSPALPTLQLLSFALHPATGVLVEH